MSFLFISLQLQSYENGVYEYVLLTEAGDKSDCDLLCFLKYFLTKQLVLLRKVGHRSAWCKPEKSNTLNHKTRKCTASVWVNHHKEAEDTAYEIQLERYPRSKEGSLLPTLLSTEGGSTARAVTTASRLLSPVCALRDKQRCGWQWRSANECLFLKGWTTFWRPDCGVQQHPLVIPWFFLPKDLGSCARFSLVGGARRAGILQQHMVTFAKQANIY